MGCFPACFGQLKRNATMEKLQDQCSSPSNEQHGSVKLLPEKTESHKEEEEIVNPTKLISESEVRDEMDKSNEEKTVLDHSNAKENNSDELEENKTCKVEDESGDKENSLQCSPVQEESSGSDLFSLSIDSRKHFLAAEMGDREVSSSLKYDGDKENASLSKDPMIDQSFDKSKPLSDRQCKRRDSEIAVETSLSSWLKLSVGSSPESEKNYGDRQILGVVVIKELNGFSSAGSTPCCSADDQIGTVGRYWQRRV